MHPASANTTAVRASQSHASASQSHARRPCRKQARIHAAPEAPATAGLKKFTDPAHTLIPQSFLVTSAGTYGGRRPGRAAVLQRPHGRPRQQPLAHRRQQRAPRLIDGSARRSVCPMAACGRWWSGVCIATLALGYTKRGCCTLHMQSKCARCLLRRLLRLITQSWSRAVTAAALASRLSAPCKSSPPGTQCRQQRRWCCRKHVSIRVIRSRAPLSISVRARSWSALGRWSRARPCAVVMALAYSGMAASSLSHSQSE